jgi:hypothetical protein
MTTIDTIGEEEEEGVGAPVHAPPFRVQSHDLEYEGWKLSAGRHMLWTAKRLIMKLAPIALGLLATASLASPAFARGGLHLLDPAWNPQHITGLPAEVRNALAHMCGDAQAGHQFASYSQSSRILVLHFEHFHCGNGRALCTQAGCLHQVYTSTGGRYRLLRTYYAPEGD